MFSTNAPELNSLKLFFSWESRAESAFQLKSKSRVFSWFVIVYLSKDTKKIANYSKQKDPLHFVVTRYRLQDIRLGGLFLYHMSHMACTFAVKAMEHSTRYFNVLGNVVTRFCLEYNLKSWIEISSRFTPLKKLQANLAKDFGHWFLLLIL